MKLFNRSMSREPAHIHECLDRLCDELSQALDTELTSIVLYGVFARLERLETHHDSVNLMLVIQSADDRTLDKMKAAITRAENEIPLRTMTLTREDLLSSCDVFPIKFHEMQQHHVVLEGDDVLADLTISDDHLRLRCEQQLKNLMLRLRAIYLHRSDNPVQLFESLVESNRNLLLDLQACLYVKTGIVPEAESDVAAEFASEFALNTQVINEILNMNRMSEIPDPKELNPMFGRFMQLVHDAAMAIDQVEVKA